MAGSTFRAAVEAKDLAAVEAVLAPDVRFCSPAVHTPYEGRDMTLKIIAAVFAVFEDFAYIGEMRTGDEEALRFTTRIGDHSLEGVDLIRYGEDGLVTELTVLVRPLQGLQAVMEAMGARLAQA